MATALGKSLPQGAIGESWELSGVEGDVSVIANGFLKDNTLAEAVEVYMGDLVGDKIYDQFGTEFPLLIKFIDSSDVLSIQVHPDDKLAAERHNSFGKTEMWYVLDADPGAELYVGFNQEVGMQKYMEHLEDGTLADILGKCAVKPGDAFFIPAGAIHAIGKGLLVAEIQQTSDVTYRVFDWNRVDKDGNGRELHTDLAIDAIDYSYPAPEYDITVKPIKNEAAKMQECPYFTSAVVEVDGEIERDYNQIDSFIIYIALDGDMTMSWGDGASDTITKGETVLIPAQLDGVTLSGKGRLIEVFVP